MIPLFPLFLIKLSGWTALGLFLTASVIFPITNVSDFQPADVEKIMNGQSLSTLVDIPGKPWPEITVFLHIPVPPSDAFAVILDVESEKKFYSELLESKIINRIDSLHRDVHFIQSMPWPLSNESYVVRQSIEALGGDRYKVNWNILSASSTKEGYGFAQFEPYSNGTLMTYKNFVEPGYEIANFPLVRRIAISQVQDVAKKMSQRIQYIRNKDPKQLKSLRENFQKILSIEVK